MNAPCMDCGLRYPGCHGKCDRYRAYRQPIEDEYRRKDNARIADDVLYNGSGSGRDRSRKRSGR